ncbi:HIT-like domain-containing protein [Paraphysoderma sedebokerense]|nr:HIT-like domain-containing protein [Paraphysoderma sedebokerense]
MLVKDSNITVFHDIAPSASTHLLAIPNAHIPNLNSLKGSDDDINLLKNMMEIGRKLLIEKFGAKDDEIRLGFHLPPFNTVQHLHLHILKLPLNSTKERIFFEPHWWNKLWYGDAEDVLKKLEANRH